MTYYVLEEIEELQDRNYPSTSMVTMMASMPTEFPPRTTLYGFNLARFVC